MRDEPEPPGLLHSDPAISTDRECTKTARTALQANDGCSNFCEALSLYVSPRSLLETDSGGLSTNLGDKAPCQNSAPPCLDSNGSDSHLAVAFHSHMPPHILLHNGDHTIEPIST